MFISLLNNKDMSKTEIDKSYFVAFCIEQYKVANNLNGAAVADLFRKHGVVDYLYEHFDVLHSQSRQWLLEEIEDFISKH